MRPLALVTGLVSLAAACLVLESALASAQTAGPRTRESLQAFSRIAEVLRHPRCRNCHPSGDFPRPTDERHRHRMRVTRVLSRSCE